MTSPLTDLVADQRQRCRAGDLMLVEAYLEAHPSLTDDPEAVVQLLVNEFLLREECGEAPSMEEYHQRFPQYAERLQRRLHP